MLETEEIQPTEKQRQEYIIAVYNNFGKKYVDYLYGNCIYPFEEGDEYPNIKDIKKYVNGNRFKEPKHYEITLTHPEKDAQARMKVIKWIEKNFDPIEYECHFEIGKKTGNYHTHIYLKTHKKFRKCRLVEVCKKFRDGVYVSVSMVKDLVSYLAYISKDDHLEKPPGFENYNILDKLNINF